MPELARFYGIIAAVYFRDHPPPHLHFREGPRAVVIAIRTGKVMEGKISKRGMAYAKLWMALHHEAILHAWDIASAGGEPARIPPLRRKGGEVARDASTPRSRNGAAYYGDKPTPLILQVEWIERDEVRLFFAMANKVRVKEMFLPFVRTAKKARVVDGGMGLDPGDGKDVAAHTLYEMPGKFVD